MAIYLYLYATGQFTDAAPAGFVRSGKLLMEENQLDKNAAGEFLPGLILLHGNFIIGRILV